MEEFKNMKKQCIVIGLGWFGMNVAKNLAEQDIEVLAIDKEISLVEKASKFVTKAVCLDVGNADAFESLPLSDFDIGVVAMAENIAMSVVSCLTLKENNVNKIIAKVGDKNHRKVLEKIGVDEIIFPEEYLGQIIAKQIMDECKKSG